MLSAPSRSQAPPVARGRAPLRGIYTCSVSTISKSEVIRVAALARVALTEEEIDRFAGELNVIAEAVASVTGVPPDVPATSHPIPMSNVMRDDVPEPTLPVEAALAAAPEAEAGMFAVPQILQEDA